MEKPNILKDTFALLDAVGKLAWESYRGNYSFYYSFIEIKRNRLEYIETIIDSLNLDNPEDKEIYDSLMNEVKHINEILSNSTKTSNLNSLLENNDEKLEGTDTFSEEEIDKLLENLEKDSPLELPTQQLDDFFVPFDFDDFPSENPIQPNDKTKIY